MKFHPEQSIAVLVDVQERLFPHIHENQELLKRIEITLKGLKLLDVPILVTEQYVKGLGPTIPELQDHIRGLENYEKISFSCCGSEEFIDSLIKSRRKEVILLGIETHVCILQSFLDLKNRGLEVVTIADCVSSRKQSDKEIALQRVIQEGGRVSTSESILLELCKEAGTSTFKEISKLIK